MTENGGVHPEERDLRSVALDPGAQSEDVRAHLQGCRACQAEVALVRGLDRVAASPTSPHPPAEDLVRFVAGAGSGEVRLAIESHRVECTECAFELAALGRGEADAPELPGQANFLDHVADLASRIRTLASFEMPVFAEVATRGEAAAAATTTADRGIDAYLAGRFEEAAALLAEARTERGAAKELAFHEGICLLRLGRPDEAVSALRAAVRKHARLGEYRWYLAQALLESGRGEDAGKELDKARKLPGPFRQRAAELHGRLKAVLAAGDDGSA